MSIQGPDRGQKPQYFDDPALDCLYQMVLVLGEELAALREQVDAIVALNDRGELPTSAALDAFDPAEKYEDVRRTFVKRLLEPLEELIEREKTS